MKNHFTISTSVRYKLLKHDNLPIVEPLFLNGDFRQVLLTLLVENRTLTVLQYDKVISYLQDRREHQVQIEIGDAKDIALKGNLLQDSALHSVRLSLTLFLFYFTSADTTAASTIARSIASASTTAALVSSAVKPALNKTQIDLQHRILNILNSSTAGHNAATAASNSVPTAVPAPKADAFLSPSKSGANVASPVTSVASGVPAPSQNWNPVSTASTTTSTVSPSPLLNDPTIQKALDELMQGNLLRKISTSTASPTVSSPSVLGSAPSQPLFGAYANLAGNRRF